MTTGQPEATWLPQKGPPNPRTAPLGVTGPSLYQTLTHELRRALLRGDYADGRQLPTEADLASEYGVSRQTVRRAFQELVADGMVYRVRGRGTFANTRGTGYVRQFGSIEDLMGMSIDTRMEVLQPLRQQVDVAAAGRLGLDSDTIHGLTFRRFHESAPLCVTRVSLPAIVGRKLADVPELTSGAISDITVIGLLDARLSSPISDAQQSITVASADASQAAALECEIGHPLLQIDRLYSDMNGMPVELAVSSFTPELYSYRMRMKRNVN